MNKRARIHEKLRDTGTRNYSFRLASSCNRLPLVLERCIFNFLEFRDFGALLQTNCQLFICLQDFLTTAPRLVCHFTERERSFWAHALAIAKPTVSLSAMKFTGRLHPMPTCKGLLTQWLVHVVRNNAHHFTSLTLPHWFTLRDVVIDSLATCKRLTSLSLNLMTSHATPKAKEFLRTHCKI